jgi:hypothetical protein
MWDSQHFATVWASTVGYGDNFIISLEGNCSGLLKRLKDINFGLLDTTVRKSRCPVFIPRLVSLTLKHKSERKQECLQNFGRETCRKETTWKIQIPMEEYDNGRKGNTLGYRVDSSGSGHQPVAPFCG